MADRIKRTEKRYRIIIFAPVVRQRVSSGGIRCSMGVANDHGCPCPLLLTQPGRTESPRAGPFARSSSPRSRRSPPSPPSPSDAAAAFLSQLSRWSITWSHLEVDGRGAGFTVARAPALPRSVSIPFASSAVSG